MAASATRFKTCLTLLAAGLAWTWLLAVTPDLQAETFSIDSIDSTANLYWAGLKALPSGTVAPNGKGSLPPSFTLPAGTSRVLQFTSVSGSLSYNDSFPVYGGQHNGPDGGAVWFADENFPSKFIAPAGLLSGTEGSPTTFYLDMASYGGISGMKLFETDPSARRVMFLAGVFTGDAAPSDPAPEILDFSSTALTRSFASLSPLLDQTFYIGDGLTGEGSGSTQAFHVPDGATHFYLGFMDGSYFVGGPDYYDNNVGSFAATFTVASSVPEVDPGSLASAIALVAGSLGLLERRRRRA
jgi:hypothetical protein